jgi:hypothetical protein
MWFKKIKRGKNVQNGLSEGGAEEASKNVFRP